MFVDYYSILEVGFDADADRIRTAWKTQAIKWHPDKNPGKDTTLRMQQINEAYLILKDQEARQLYDQEYRRFRSYQQQQTYAEREHRSQWKQEASTPGAKTYRSEPFSTTFEDSSYEVFDETLYKWMSNARRQSVDLAKQTLEDLIGMSKAGGKVMGEAAMKGVIKLVIFSIIMAFIFKACR